VVGDLPEDLAAATALGGEMGRRFAEYDWSAHPLGPVDRWPADFRATVAVALTSRFPIVLWLGADDLFLVYNDGYIPMLGDKHPAALGTRGRSVWWEIWPQIGPMLAGVVKTGEATWSDDLMLALVTAGRPQERFFTFSYGPMLSDDGQVSGVFCAVNETTQRVRGERRLQILAAAAATLMETRTVDEAVRATVQACADGQQDLAFVAIYVGDGSGASRLRGASPPVIDLLPATLDKFAAAPDIDDARPLTRLVDDLSNAVPELLSVFDEDCPESALVIDLTEAGPDSVASGLVIGLNPRQPLDDQYVGFCRLLADQVSSAFATANSYEQERRRADMLAELDRTKTAFLTNVSHEFRTPLTLLIGPLDDAIADARSEPLQLERLETARRNAGRLLRLVNSFLEFTRIEAGRATVSIARVDLGTLTEQIASSFAGLCERAGIELVLDCEPVTAEVDVALWETIVLNLLSNAVKFTLQGSITVQVGPGPSQESRLRVVDTGSGIPEADVVHLFDRFYRAPKTRGRSVEGSGIGLSLVRSLTELHHGTVHIESTVDVGTTVTIDLPSAPDIGTTTVPLAELPALGQPTGNAYVAEAMQWLDVEMADPTVRSSPADRTRPLVLIADDNPDMRRHLNRILSPLWDTVMFADGEAALNGVRRYRPDLVVTDVMMPTMDGFELVAAIRDAPGLASTPVLILSARAGADAAGDGYATGADDYLTKPFTSQELVNRVRAHLNAVVRHRADREYADEQMRREAAFAEITSALTAAESTESALVAMLTSPAVSLGATAVAIGVLDPFERHVTVDYAGDIGAELRDRYHRMARDAPVPLAEVTRTGQSMVISDGRLLEPRFDRVMRDAAPHIRAAVIHPLRDSASTIIGVMALLWPEPRSFDQTELSLIGDLASVTGLAMARIRAAEREHRIATDFQDHLLDLDQSSTAVVVSAVYQPAAEAMRVGGDWYLVTPLDETRVGLCVGDVVGHGLAAATVMGKLRAAVAATAMSSGAPSDILATVQRYAATVPGARGTTLTYATLDTAAGTIDHVCAGHPYPLLVAPDGTTRFLFGGRVPPLAAVSGSPSGPSETADVPVGSLLILYTDGLIERYGESVSEGLARLATAATACATLPVDDVCSTLLERQAPPGDYTDDVGILAVRPTGATETSFVAVLPADPTQMAPLRHRLRRWLARLELDGTLNYRIVLGVGEALANAIEHGSGMDAGKTVSVEVFADVDAIRATVSDAGQWSADSAASRRSADRGWGLTLINGLADAVDTVRTARGTHVTVQFPRLMAASGTGVQV
jgi:signal transduction histidine kinase/DNA-binding response OmpR family regulator